MGINKKIDALKGAAEKKRLETLEKTNNAISQLIKDGKEITFYSVARAADVSVAYLYKYEEIKDRINYLRNQQKEHIKSYTEPQLASQESKLAINIQFKERIKKLDLEIRGLREQNEEIYGRYCELRSFKEEVETLRLENARLQKENQELRQQVDNYQQQALKPDLFAPLAEAKDSNVTFLHEKKPHQPGISDKINLQLSELKIKLSPSLSKTIKSASEQVVLNTIEALKEAIANENVKQPEAWLNKAIKEGWLIPEKDT